jgi:hypothetical protein
MAKKIKLPRHQPPVIILDNIPIRLENPDLDGDGFIDGVEHLTQHPDLANQGIAHLQQSSELAESLDKLDSDVVDPDTKMSEIDFNANLNPIEKNGYGVLDFLVSASFLPEDVQFLTRRFKRLSVSVGGIGRQQKVQMVTGEREHQRGLGGSLMDSVRGFFGGGDKGGGV